MYKAILFDFGGVVFKNKESYEGPQGMLEIEKTLWNQGLVGKVADNDIFSIVSKKYDVDTSTIESWLISRREVNTELLNLVAELPPAIKTAIVNNGLKTLFHALLSKYHVSDKFDLVVNSAEEGVAKPDSGLYLITCWKLGVEPTECVFIDDNAEFIQGARALGMLGIQFTTVSDLRADFVKLGIVSS